jgi:hypothetical protein
MDIIPSDDLNREFEETPIDVLNESFKKAVTSSLKKAYERKPCPHGERCYRKNPEHFKEFSHPSNKYSDGDIAAFKDDTDRFLSLSYRIYEQNGGQFSDAWISKISARTGDDNTQFAQSEYDKYDSFYFLLLANIIMNLGKYEQIYTPEFLKYLLISFESADATGLFDVNRDSTIARKLSEYGVEEFWLLSNTTILASINNRKNKRTSDWYGDSNETKRAKRGGGARKRTKHLKKKNKTLKKKRTKHLKKKYIK